MKLDLQEFQKDSFSKEKVHRMLYQLKTGTEFPLGPGLFEVLVEAPSPFK